ncbi:hypothetical protein C8R43DRAFT_964550 [Mycena crocata]|nr:hypothetical protein C8R43DRAFT_964550 [Mycena crocata]
MCTQVDGVLYKVHRSLLTAASAALDDILDIPDGKKEDDPDREGTEKYPLYFEGITKTEFEDLLGGFLYHHEWQTIKDVADKERIYINLLKLSHKWQMTAGRAYAIKNLSEIYLTPAHRLELARKFSIPDWVEPAVKWILNRKLSELSGFELEQIGIQIYAILVKGKEHLDTEVRRTANIAPAMRWWRKEIGWGMLHPKYPKKPSDILWELDKFHHPGLNEECRKDMRREIHENILFFDEKVVAATAAAAIAIIR